MRGKTSQNVSGRSAAYACAAMLLVACGNTPEGEGAAAAADAGCRPEARYASSVSDYAFGLGQQDGRDRFPEIVFGPPKGAGCCQGSTTDVASLGNGGSVTLGFEASISDLPGPDFIVFENPFWVNGDSSQVFAELATVSVSADGVEFVDFACTAVAPPYGSCAGWHPVYANPDQNDIDPLDPDTAGGDAFDLAEVGLSTARFVRIVDREDLTGTNGVFDLDAVGIVHAACP